MRVLDVMNGVAGYPALLAYVLRNGVRRHPRGLETLDAGPTTVTMHDVSHALPLGTGRNLSREVAAAEALQLIGGFSAPELLPPAFDAYREPDGSFWGAYGDRIGDQAEQQLEKLRHDPDSRQSVITLWNPTSDNQPNKRDYPCTVALTLWLDDGRLCLLTTMRSQDVWLGAPYDWWQFTQLQQTLARLLGVSTGAYRHTSASTHLYTRDVEAARALVDRWYAVPSLADQPRVTQPAGLGVDATTTFAELRRRCQNLREYAQGWQTLPDDTTESEMWYADNLECFGKSTNPSTVLG